jgi:hypothetical protein
MLWDEAWPSGARMQYNKVDFYPYTILTGPQENSRNARFCNLNPTGETPCPQNLSAEFVLTVTMTVKLCIETNDCRCS